NLELPQLLEEKQAQLKLALGDEEFENIQKIRSELIRIEQAIESGGSEIQVTVDSIADIVASMTGVDRSNIGFQSDRAALDLADSLKARVVGQDHVIDQIASDMRRSRAGLGDPSRPKGSYIFAGPTGVGKTLLAKALAENLY